MKYKLTKAEQETVINFDNELDTASIYTHDSRLIKKLRELRKQYPEQFILEHREHGSVTYTIPKRCVGIRPPYSEKRRGERGGSKGKRPAVYGEGRNERWQELKNGMKCMERRHRTKE